MKLWKYDVTACNVRCVEGEPYPGKDVDGCTCYTNTHFTTAAEAWEATLLSAKAIVDLAGALLDSARNAVRDREAMARDVAIMFSAVNRNYAVWLREEGRMEFLARQPKL